jgi:hypothetical protein
MLDRLAHRHLTVVANPETGAARVEVHPGEPDPFAVTVRPSPAGGWELADSEGSPPAARATFEAALTAAVSLAAFVLADRLVRGVAAGRPGPDPRAWATTNRAGAGRDRASGTRRCGRVSATG